jgi:hypothetical protein
MRPASVVLATSIALSVIALVAVPLPAAAQTPGRPIEVSGGVAAMQLSELDHTNVGLRGTVDWSFARLFAIDGALTWFPGGSNSPTSVLAGQQRLLGAIGVKAAATQSRLELYGRGGIGFLSFSTQEQQPPPCRSQIITVTLQCGLAVGYTAFTTEIGGGATIGLTSGGRPRIRIDAADVIVRYGSVVARTDGRPASAFYSHNFLLSTGVSWRF